MFQARAYIINLLLLSLSLSNFAFANRLQEQDLPHLPPEAQRQLQEAGLGLGFGGRPVAYGQQGLGQQGAGQSSIRPRFQEWAIKYPNLAPQIPELDRRVSEVNNMALDETTRKKMFPELISWIRGTLGDKQVNEDKLYGHYCIREGTLSQPPPQGTKPEGAASSEGNTSNDAASSDSSSETAGSVELVSPPSRNRSSEKAGVEIGEVEPTPARPGWVARNFGEVPPTPNRRVDAQGNPITGPQPRYNPDGCEVTHFPNQTFPQGNEAANNPNNDNSGDSEGGSPSDETQPPNGGGGGGGYSSKNQGVKAPNIAEPSPYGQMPGSAQIDGSCMFCSAIAEAGKSKYQYNGAATVQGIGKDLEAQKAQRDEIMSKSSFIPPRALPMGNQRRSTGEALSSTIGKKGAANPLSLMPNL